MKLSVIIVNYNVCYFLEQCLHTVIKAGEGLEIEIIVVDNASSDNSRQYLPDRFPQVKFIWNEINKGFGVANNQAMAIARGEYMLLLNPDTLLPTGALAACIRFFQANPDAGAVGMRMYDGSGKYLPESKRGLPDVATSFYKLSGLIRLFPNHRAIGNYYLGHLSPEQVQQIDVIAGAFMMIPRQVYEKVGGFDEMFFMYGEDIDLSYRIKLAGHKNYYLPLPGLIHFKGESTTKDLQYTRYFYEAMQLFVRKHFGQRSLLLKWALEGAIVLRGSISGFKRLFPGKKTTGPGEGKFVVLGDAESKQELIGTLAGGIVSDGEGRNIIYALGNTFGVEDVLATWKKNPATGQSWFHYTGTSAVIASSDKKSNGEVMLVKKDPSASSIS